MFDIVNVETLIPGFIIGMLSKIKEAISHQCSNLPNFTQL